MTGWKARMGRWSASVALVLVSAWLALWAAEYALRLAFHGRLGYAAENEREWHVPHATRGWAHRPGAVFHMQKLAFSQVATINSKGVRGPEFDAAPKPGVFRILVVSDSGTFGSGVGDREHLAAQLQDALGAGRFEVINLSVAAYSTVQEYLWLVEEGLKYKPDLVLLGFSPGNDVQTSHYPLQRWFQRDARRPYARLDAAGKVVIDNEPLATALDRQRKGPGLGERVYDALVGPMTQKVIRQANRALGGGR
ncbi:MAG: hypothetical protein JNL07_12060, partial [Rhodospirillales bacterium]|nr:hypothetical protein [Rhodospirillales bacterium]